MLLTDVQEERRVQKLSLKMYYYVRKFEDVLLCEKTNERHQATDLRTPRKII